MHDDTFYVKKNIAGDIAISDSCADSFKRWREVFGIKQSEIAKRLQVSPSVISDYMSGRRNSPGTNFVKRYVETLVDYDLERGGLVCAKFMDKKPKDAIIEMSEFEKAMDASMFLDSIDAEVVVHKQIAGQTRIRGFTVIDSIQAILNMSGDDFSSIYGRSSERALVFTKVKMGRSPMIAVKVTRPKPGLIILHGLDSDDIDPLAVHIAQKENIPLAVSRVKDEKELVERIRGCIR